MLFIDLVFIAVQFFNCLNKRVNFLLIDYNSGLINDSGLAVRLEKWKNHHILVYQFVRWINHCYDPIIFFVICHGFMTIVGYSFGVVEAFTRSMNDIKYLFVGLLLQEFLQLLIFIYISVKLASEAYFLNEKLKIISFKYNLISKEKNCQNSYFV